MVQLVTSIYLAIAFDEIYQRRNYLAQIICVFYPPIMGSIKSLQNYFIKDYDVETIYEFLSLGLAAFPYRFLFLSVDLPLIAAGIVTIKLTYKMTSYFFLFTPLGIRIMNIFKRSKKVLF